MGEGRSKMLHERLGWCLGARGRVLWQIQYPEALWKHRKRALFPQERSECWRQEYNSCDKPLLLHSWSSIPQEPYHLGTPTTVNVKDSLPTMAELSGESTFSQINHLPLWQHPSLPTLQLHHPTFALYSCSILLVLLREVVTIHVSR